MMPAALPRRITGSDCPRAIYGAQTSAPAADPIKRPNCRREIMRPPFSLSPPRRTPLALRAATTPPVFADEHRTDLDAAPSTMLKYSLSPRLFKKVQVQGGARGEARGVLCPYVAAPRECANAADGPFSAA